MMANITDVLDVGTHNVTTSSIPPPQSGANEQSSFLEALKMIGIVLASLGVIGNAVSISVLTHRSFETNRLVLGCRPFSARKFLVALAVSDLLFCVHTLAFRLSNAISTRSEGEVTRVFVTVQLYCLVVINSLILTSTYMVVLLTLDRYLRIRHPLAAENSVLSKHPTALVIAICIGAMILNMFWIAKYELVYKKEQNTWIAKSHSPFGIQEFPAIYRGVWATITNIIPIITLVVTNTFILRRAFRAYSSTRSILREFTNSTEERERNQATIVSNTLRMKHPLQTRTTLLIIVITIEYLLLVVPSELYAFIDATGEINLDKQKERILKAFFNDCLLINFSTNFFIYWFISPIFRRGVLKRHKQFRNERAKHSVLASTRRYPSRETSNEAERRFNTRIDTECPINHVHNMSCVRTTVARAWNGENEQNGSSSCGPMHSEPPPSSHQTNGNAFEPYSL